MGQKLFEDKITPLTESGGTISLAAGARLSIGGQQYVTDSVLDVSANLDSANTRYQIYAVLSGGVPALVVSQNENSVGPAGYNAWKLVGSYTTDWESTSFDQFYNIDGIPKNRTRLNSQGSDSTTTGRQSNLEFNNLKIGTYYELNSQFKVFETGFGNSFDRFDFTVSISNNGNILIQIDNDLFDSGNNISDYRHCTYPCRMFKAEDSLLEVDWSNRSNTTLDELSYVELTERNDLTFTRPIKDL